MTRFLTIPGEILHNRSLNFSEKVVLAQIYNFCKDGKECFASNEYLSILLGVDEKILIKIIDALVSFGLISEFAGRKNLAVNLEFIKTFNKKNIAVHSNTAGGDLKWQNSQPSWATSAGNLTAQFTQTTKQEPM